MKTLAAAIITSLLGAALAVNHALPTLTAVVSR